MPTFLVIVGISLALTFASNCLNGHFSDQAWGFQRAQGFSGAKSSTGNPDASGTQRNAGSKVTIKIPPEYTRWKKGSGKVDIQH